MACQVADKGQKLTLCTEQALGPLQEPVLMKTFPLLLLLLMLFPFPGAHKMDVSLDLIT